MKNYRKQTIEKKCKTCLHCFMREEYDEYPTFYCTHDAETRPPCCSILMSEYDTTWPSPRRDMYKLWDEWAEGKGVDEDGICDYYKLK